MLILIAESKTMTGCDDPVTSGQFHDCMPLFEEYADEIMSHLKDKTVEEIASEVGISVSLARQMQKMIYEFPNKNLGQAAIWAYTGVVFKSLDPSTLSTGALRNVERDVRIISSLYGLLNPTDIIKGYRTEFKSEISPDKTPLWKFYRRYNTIALGKTLQQANVSEILNLLPGDAAKSIDWKTIKRFAKVYKADFIEFSAEGPGKTPNAGKLKKLRGALLRQIVTDNILKVSDLLHIESSEYMCEGTPVYPDHLQFITV